MYGQDFDTLIEKLGKPDRIIGLFGPPDEKGRRPGSGGKTGEWERLRYYRGKYNLDFYRDDPSEEHIDSLFIGSSF